MEIPGWRMGPRALTLMLVVVLITQWAGCLQTGDPDSKDADAVFRARYEALGYHVDDGAAHLGVVDASPGGGWSLIEVVGFEAGEFRLEAEIFREVDPGLNQVADFCWTMRQDGDGLAQIVTWEGDVAHFEYGGGVARPALSVAPIGLILYYDHTLIGSWKAEEPVLFLLGFSAPPDSTSKKGPVTFGLEAGTLFAWREVAEGRSVCAPGLRYFQESEYVAAALGTGYTEVAQAASSFQSGGSSLLYYTGASDVSYEVSVAMNLSGHWMERWQSTSPTLQEGRRFAYVGNSSHASEVKVSVDGMKGIKDAEARFYALLDLPEVDQMPAMLPFLEEDWPH